jgi:hypothetical protein
MESLLLIALCLSVATAGGLGVRAWREARREQDDSDARVAALAADIFAPDAELAAAETDPTQPVLLSESLFARTAAASEWSVQGLYLVAAGTLVLLVAGGAALSRAPRGSLPELPLTAGSLPTEATQNGGASAAVHTVEPPLELVKLEHSRQARQLEVSGIVRNPPEGSTRSALAVVVLLFGNDGVLAGSGSAPLDSLGPGLEKHFAVAVPMTDGVGRYRVMLRAAGRVVPHIDRRS